MSIIDFKYIMGIASLLDKNFEEMTKEEVCRGLAVLKLAGDEMEVLEKKLKSIVLKKGYSAVTFPDLQTKVEVSSGYSSTTFDVEKIGKFFAKKGKLDLFFKLVNIVQKKVSENLTSADPLYSAIAKNRHTSTGAPYVRVAKLSKNDLADAI